jgi:hypothetical protein
MHATAWPKSIHGLICLSTAAALWAAVSDPLDNPLPQDLSACKAADAVIAREVKSLLADPMPPSVWMSGNGIGAAKMARALCLGDQPARGLIVYGRIADLLGANLIATQTASVAIDNSR